MHKLRFNLGGEGINTTNKRSWLSRQDLGDLFGDASGRSICFLTDGDPGTGGGAPPVVDPNAPPAVDPNAAPPTDEDPFAGLTEEQKTKLKAHQQKEFDRIAAKAREEGKKSGKTEAEKLAEDQRKETERLDKVKQGEFKTLYDTAQKELDAVKPKAEAYTALAAEFHTLIDGEIAEWPESLKKADPGKDATIEARRKWLTDSRDLAKELINARKPPAGEHGGGSGGGGTPPKGGAYETYTATKRYAVPGQQK